MSDLVQKLVDIALKEAGVKEEGGDNKGARIVEYQSATWLAPGPWPWCAAFTAWIMREWLEDSEVRKALDLNSSSAVGLWRCRDAAAFGWETWAKKRNLLVLPESKLAKSGDFVVYDFSHIGIVYKDQSTLSESIETVEGNTHSKDMKNGESGDGVWKKVRAPSLVKSYIRLFS